MQYAIVRTKNRLLYSGAKTNTDYTVEWNAASPYLKATDGTVLDKRDVVKQSIHILVK